MSLKKVISLVLLLCILVSSFLVPAVSAADSEIADVSAGISAVPTGADYGLASNVQDGVILHCWNWSYNNIKNNMANIAAQGFTSLQVSPVQVPKESVNGRSVNSGWWVLYQPGGFSMNNEGGKALGTKSEFKAMCDEAHKYGIYVIVDIVANHLGNRTDAGNLCDAAYSYESEIARNWLFHNAGGSNDSSAYTVTKGHIGMPDLQTENSHVQQRVLSLLKECIDCGADGFRFDAAKHIETPDDGNEGSQFWPTVINGAVSYAKSTKNKTIYNYGEILNTPGGGRSFGSYTKYMSITDNVTGNNIRNSVVNGNASGAANSHYNSGQSPDKIVLWAESHDTYANSEQESTHVSDENMKKTWAMVASREDATALYFARPSDFGSRMGNADKTSWSHKEVQAVNKFHNYFVGQSEYLGSSGSLAYVRRGDSGVVIVNCGGGSTNVNLQVNGMKDGTYKDAVSGNTFTVSGGNIRGQMASSGIAVVYNESTKPMPTISQQGGVFRTDTLSLTIGLSNATSGTYSINGGTATTYTGTKTITIGSGVSAGSSVTVALSATDGKTTNKATYTFTKVDASAAGVYYDNSKTNWNKVNCYMYNDKGDKVAEWPGKQMENIGGGIWYMEVPKGYENCYVIFSNDGQNQVPGAGEPGYRYAESAMIYSNGNWQDYVVVTPTKPTTPTQPTKPTQPTTQATDPTEKPTQPIDPTGEKYLYGDVDFDGKVTIKDATLIQKFCAELTQFSPLAEAVSKVAGKAVTTVSDSTAIQKMVAGLITDFASGKWYVVKGTGTTDPTEPTTTTKPVDNSKNTIYFRNTAGWGSVTAYFWSDKTGDVGSGSWPGVSMTYVSGDVYKITIDKKYEMIIFSSKGSGQTKDLVVPGNNKIYDYQTGNWSDYSENPPVDPPTGSTVTVYFVDTNGWGSAKVICWQDSNSNNRDEISMQFVGDNKYKVTIDKKYDKLYFTNGNQKTQDLRIPENGGTYINNQGWS